MTKCHDLRAAIVAVYADNPWIKPSDPQDDVNHFDFWKLAREVETKLHMTPPRPTPARKADGQRIVDLVGKVVISPAAGPKINSLRTADPELVADRVIALAKCIESEGLLFFDKPGIFLAAFYSYQGFFNVAKSTRPTYVAAGGGEADYSEPQRKVTYDLTRDLWTDEDDRDNPWVLYGSTLVRTASLAHVPVDNWIPKGEPYWN